MAYLGVMGFLSSQEKMPGALLGVLGATTLVAVGIALGPVYFLLFGPKAALATAAAPAPARAEKFGKKGKADPEALDEEQVSGDSLAEAGDAEDVDLEGDAFEDAPLEDEPMDEDDALLASDSGEALHGDDSSGGHDVMEFDSADDHPVPTGDIGDSSFELDAVVDDNFGMEDSSAELPETFEFDEPEEEPPPPPKKSKKKKK